MISHDFTCPCCGRSYVLLVSDNNITVDCGEVASIVDDAIVKLASCMGIECGALKGGEKIG